mgnify:CR=1 FL=1
MKMDRKTRDIIESVVNAVKTQLGINIRPNFEGWEDVIHNLGGELKKDPNLLCDARISKVSNNGENGVFFKVEVSPFQSEARMNFSIAHELGHLFLHMLYKINYDEWSKIQVGESYNRSGNNELESQANEFAAELLMPKGEFLQVLSKNRETINSYNIEPVARYFGVSEQAVLNRGRWLGVFAW